MRAYSICCRAQKSVKTCGRVRAEPSLQVGTLSTRIANLLCIIHSALSRLSCRGRAAYGAHTRAWRPSAARGQTDARQTRLTNQPTGQPDSIRFASTQL